MRRLFIRTLLPAPVIRRTVSPPNIYRLCLSRNMSSRESKRQKTSASTDEGYDLLYWPGMPGRGESIRLCFEETGTPYNDVANTAKDGIVSLLTCRVPYHKMCMGPGLLRDRSLNPRPLHAISLLTLSSPKERRHIAHRCCQCRRSRQRSPFRTSNASCWQSSSQPAPQHSSLSRNKT